MPRDVRIMVKTKFLPGFSNGSIITLRVDTVIAARAPANVLKPVAILDRFSFRGRSGNAWPNSIAPQDTQAERMSRKQESQTGQKIGTGLVAAFLCWLVWAGVHALAGVITDGRIVNRRGPDVYMSDSPIIFWALSGFFALGLHLATGLALICLLNWLSLFRRSDRK